MRDHWEPRGTGETISDRPAIALVLLGVVAVCLGALDILALLRI